MTRNLAFTLLIGIAATTHADAPPNVQYPFLAPRCNDFIVTPPNQPPALFSEDCTTAYVLPDLVGQAQVNYLKNYTNPKICDSLYNLQDAEATLNAEISRISGTLTTLNIDDPRRDKVLAEINTINNSIDKLYVNYEQVAGGDAEVRFSVSDDQTRRNNYLLANAQVFRQGLNIQSAPIQESFLSFNLPNKNLLRAGVLDFKVAGVAVASNTDPDMKVYRAGFNSVAALTLSLWGTCPGRGLPPPTSNDLGLSVSPTVTYTVPVLAWAGYSASLDNQQAIQNVLKVFETKSQFSTTDQTSIDAVGSAANAYQFSEFNVGAAGFSASQRQDFFASLRQDVLDRLTARLLEQMAVAGFVQLTQAPAPIEAPAPGTITQVQDGGTSCSGALWWRSCVHRTYTLKIPVSSSASQLVQKYVNLNFSNTEVVQSRETVPRFYTTVYELKKPTANTRN